MFNSIYQFLTDPIWFWFFLSLAIISGSVAVAYFFSFLRTYAGIAILTVIAMLVSYRKGEVDKARQIKKNTPVRSDTPIEDMFKPWPR